MRGRSKNVCLGRRGRRLMRRHAARLTIAWFRASYDNASPTPCVDNLLARSCMGLGPNSFGWIFHPCLGLALYGHHSRIKFRQFIFGPASVPTGAIIGYTTPRCLTYNKKIKPHVCLKQGRCPCSIFEFFRKWAPVGPPCPGKFSDIRDGAEGAGVFAGQFCGYRCLSCSPDMPPCPGSPAPPGG